ncbi:endonuclease/exonuclease/phosphatase family protein [Streptomyces antimycoticus]
MLLQQALKRHPAGDAPRFDPFAGAVGRPVREPLPEDFVLNVKRVLAALAGVAMIGLAVPATASQQVREVVPAADEEPLKPIPNRFMTWNTNGQDLGTPKAIAEQIKSFRPQVVALQESCLNEVREAVRQLNEAGVKYEYRSGLSALNFGCPGRLGTAIIYTKGTTVRAHNKKGYSDVPRPVCTVT